MPRPSKVKTYLRTIAASGGKATLAKHGAEHFARAGKLSALKRWVPKAMIIEPIDGGYRATYKEHEILCTTREECIVKMLQKLSPEGMADGSW